jgi:hypothetical protein
LTPAASIVGASAGQDLGIQQVDDGTRNCYYPSAITRLEQER